MKRFITDAGKAILFLATVAGLLIAADAAGYLIVGILVIALGFVWAAITVAYPRVIDIVTRIRNYPHLLQQAADLGAELTDVRERLRELEVALRTHHQQSVTEGNMQVIGAAFAHAAKLPLELVTISVDGTGTVILTGRYTQDSSIRLGARFEVQVVGTGERKGIVQVTRIDSDAGYVHMKCVERTAESFWTYLENRAVGNPSPPDGVKLAPAPFPFPGDAISPDDT